MRSLCAVSLAGLALAIGVAGCGGNQNSSGNQAANAVASGANAVASGANAMGQSAANNVKSAAHNAKSAANNMANGAANAAGSAAHGVTNAAGAAAGAAGAAAHGVANAAGNAANSAANTAQSMAASSSDGATVFVTNCSSCHGASGQGSPGAFPPLAGNAVVTGDPVHVIHIVKDGLTGQIVVAGKTYNGTMPPWGKVLSNADMAAALTYVRSAWGNHAGAISPAQVGAVK
jgi:mono/diheme cytochrome c family protein